MPRPKRSKIISAHGQARATTALSEATRKPSASTRAGFTKEGLQSPKNGRTEFPPTSKSHTSTTDFVQQDGVEISMSGGLGFADVSGAHDLRDERKRRSRASRGIAEQTQRSSRTRFALAEISFDHNVSQASSSAASKRQRSKAILQSPWLDSKNASASLDEGFEEYLRSSSPHLPTTIISRPPSASKVQGTPSFLSIANFKRRPRQPSILRMVQQKVANDAEIVADSDQDSTLDDIGAFDDDDAAVQSSTSSKRKASVLDPSCSVMSHTGIQSDDSSRHNKRSRLSSALFSARGATLDDADGEAGGESPDLPVRSHSRSPSAPIFKQTPPPRRRGRGIPPKRPPPKPAASPSPPISDMSPQSTPNSTNRKHMSSVEEKAQRAGRRNKHVSETHKSSKAANRRTITTAALQSQLPRRRTRQLRRQRQESAAGVPSSSSSFEEDNTVEVIVVEPGPKHGNSISSETEPLEDDDEDELTKPQPRAKKARPPNERHPKSGKATMSTRRRKTKTATKAYSRRRQRKGASSDSVVIDSRVSLSHGEGEDVVEASGKGAKDDDGMQKTPELTEAAKKFLDVDEWELSFESVDVGGASSSPWR